MASDLHAFPDGAALAEALAADLASALTAGLAGAERVTLALSGGKTPGPMLAALGRADLPWERVVAIPVDERWVPETSDRSNGALLRRALPRAALVPMYTGAAEPDRAAVEARIAAVPWPPCALVLGMGDDGHTASWFPGGDGLHAALTAGHRVETVRAAAAGEPRVTLTLSAVLSAELLVLHLEGARKRAVLEEAQSDGPTEDLPIRAVLRRAADRLRIYWSP